MLKLTSKVFRNLRTKLGGWGAAEEQVSEERSSGLKVSGVLGVVGCGVGLRVAGESLVEERFMEGEVEPSPKGIGSPFRVLLWSHSNVDGGWEGGGGGQGGGLGGGHGGGADGGGGGVDRDGGREEEEREWREREEQGEDDWVN